MKLNAKSYTVLATITWANSSLSSAFVPLSATVRHSKTALSVSTTPPPFFADDAFANGDDNQIQESSLDFRLSIDESNPLIRIGTGESQKIINAFGLWCAAVSIFTGVIWMAAMTIVDASLSQNEAWDPHREIFDKTGKIWAKTWLTLTNSFPDITGDVGRLKEAGACLYVSNHASWMDIPVLCTVLDPVFKFIAKGELRKVPCIGHQLEGGNHILIDREDRRSQIKTFKDGIAWLKKGVPIMAFPEGQRSRDGRLMDFKKGIFSMAVKLGVPIVPITISNTHVVMPTFSFFPVQPGAGKLHVHVGQPILPEGKTEADLEELVRNEFLTHLPESQLPLPLLPAKAEAQKKELQLTTSA